ncbi:hypothetical protein L1049_014362 [Liquidambar formosana]|uniref:Uncharacterized protein n=1 Tax=Liquidambar formosana TaxID=63359 RepID=A0AAP0RMV9_LIQFO
MAPIETHELTPSSEEEHCFYAMQLASASVFPMVMQAAIDLELLEILSRAGPGAHLSAQEIASQLPTQNPQAPEMVDRILRLLASHSVLTCTTSTTVNPNLDGGDSVVVHRLYGLAPASNYFLSDYDSICLTPTIQMFNDKVFMDCWHVLKDAVLEGGIPFNKVYGVHAFEYAGKDPRFNLVFNKAMTSHTTLVMKSVLKKYKGFEGIKELVDVGGGLGLTLEMIKSQYPTIKGINFDLPHVIQNAPSYPGVQHLPGDMFVGIPKGEAILLKCILHDWTEDHSLKILKNCYAALPGHGKVIVIEYIVPEAPETNAATRSLFQIDLVMMAQNPGGKERTRLEFESLAKRAGFRGVRYECYACNYWVMEFYNCDHHQNSEAMASSAETQIRTFSNGDNDDEQHCSYAMQLVSSSVLPMVMQAAIELNLLEIIAKAGPGGRLSSSEIAAQLPTQNPDAPIMVDRILRLLATHSVLTCSVADGGGGGGDNRFQRLYGLAPVCKYLVRNEDGVSLGPLMSLLQDKVFMDSWSVSKLKDAVLEGGIPFNKVHGAHAFEYPGKDRRFNQVFNTAMYNHTTIIVKKILESYKGFEHLKQVVDVGGGLGVTLSIITSKYPSIRGINFDLPHVIQHAPPYPGVEHVGGDMFESVPRGDAIFMKWILHDWSDDHCLKLLKNCYKALPDNGKVIVVEAVFPVIPETSTAVKGISQLDLLMMTQNPGGKERTQQEFTALAMGAGFSRIRYERLVCTYWVMELYK